MSKTRIGFRGFKTEDPGKIFTTGFNLIQSDNKEPVSILYGGDVNPKSAICVTWRLSAAGYFPLPMGKTDDDSTWIFVVNILLPQAGQDQIFSSAIDFKKIAINEKQQLFINTHGRQVLDILRTGSNPKGHNDTYQMLFADEIAVDHIESKNIIAYLKCHRIWNDSNDWSKGGRYQLEGPIVYQDKSVLDKSINHEQLKFIQSFLEEEIKLSQEKFLSLPLAESAYTRSEVKNTTGKISETIEIDEKEYNAFLEKLVRKNMLGELRPSDLDAAPKSLHKKIVSDLNKKSQEFEELEQKNRQHQLDQKNLFDAVKQGKIKIVNTLCSRGVVDLNEKDEQGCTALQIAAIMNRSQVIKKLIEKGAPMESVDQRGFTALHFAALSGSSNALKMLLDFKADKEAKNISDYTPLHLAAFYGNLNGLKILLEAKANLEVENKLSQAPLDCAIEKSQFSIIECLLAYGASAVQSLERADNIEKKNFIMLQLLKFYIQCDEWPMDSIPHKQLNRIIQEENLMMEQKKPLNWSKTMIDITEIAQANHLTQNNLKAHGIFSEEKNLNIQKYLKWFSSESILKEELLKEISRNLSSNKLPAVFRK